MEKIGQFFKELFFKILGGVPKALGGFWGWVAGLIIKRVVTEVEEEVVEIKEKAEKKAERKETNDENAKKYVEAESRADKIKAAENLLSRHRD